MATAVSGGGLSGLASRADKVALARDLAPAAGSNVEEGLAFMIVEEEEKGAEDIMRKA